MSDNPKQAEMVRRAINAKTMDELEELYDDWADSYDEYLESLSYMAPTIGAQLLAEHLSNKNISILDVGCGTGLVGIQLAQHGYGQIDGIDLSEGMLALAKETGRYSVLTQGDINQPFPEILTEYDATISIGILGIHVGTAALDEMVRLTRRGGLVALSIRNPYYEPSGYQAHVQRMVNTGKIKLLAEMEKPYILNEGATAMYLVMERS